MDSDNGTQFWYLYISKYRKTRGCFHTYYYSYYNSLFETSLIRYTFYYILVFVENTGLMLFWFKKAIKMIGIICLHL